MAWGNLILTLTLLVATLIAPTAAAQVIITEIHPYPEADESLNEWVELYNNGSAVEDLSQYTISDRVDSDKLVGGLFEGEGVLLHPGQFALVTDDKTRVYNNFRVPFSALRIYVDDGAIGNGLSNNGESLSLQKETSVHAVTYGSVDQGYSVTNVAGEFVHSLPTPGFDSVLNLEESCDYSIEFVSNETIFSQEEFTWKARVKKKEGSSTFIDVNASLVDTTGSAVKTYAPFTNQSISTQRTTSTYSPNLRGGEFYFLIASLNTQCEDYDLSNNKVEKTILITESKPETSSLAIASILDMGSDDRATFGQTLRTRVEVYKGDTTKESVQAWVEKGSTRVSKKSSVSLTEKFRTSTVTLPIQLHANCDGKYRDGRYTLVVEGLDARAEKEFTIDKKESLLCEKETAETIKPKAKPKLRMETISVPSYQSGISSEIQIQLINEGDATVEGELWSYVYRGSKSYSGERRQNTQHIRLKPNTVSEIRLENMPVVEEEGDYKLKIVMQPTHRVTPLKETHEVKVYLPVVQQATVTESVKANNEIKKSSFLLTSAVARDIVIPETLYVSSSEKAKDYVSLFLVMFMLLLCVTLIVFH